MGHTETKDNRLDELRKQHGELAECTVEGVRLAFRKPNRAEYKRFTDQVGKDRQSKSAAIESFVLACGVYPDRAAVTAAIESKPAVAVHLCPILEEMAGGDIEITVNKS
jgi:hypothetical protein